MSTPEPSDALVRPSLAQQLVEPSPDTARPRKRGSRTLWIVVGIVVGILVLAGAGVAAFLLLSPRAEAGPSAAVLGYDEAYADADCEAFVAVTTAAYREALAPTCADFEAEAHTFAENFSDYEVVIESTEIDGGTATVVTTESWLLDGDQNSRQYTYTLVEQDGGWRIDELR